MLGGYLNYITGHIAVEEVKNQIKVTGLPTSVLVEDIYRVWSTSKIANYLFTRIGRHELVFNRFFTIDVIYLLETIQEQAKAKSNKRIIGRVIQELSTQTWLGRITSNGSTYLDFSQLRRLNCTLLEHQQRFLELYNKVVPRYGLNGYMLAAAPGGGKTINSIALHLVSNNDVCICVVPKNSVTKVWSNTLDLRLTEPAEWWSTESPEPFNIKATYFIIHYEFLAKAIEYLKPLIGLNITVVLDESHNLNELGSQRTNIFMDLCKTLRAKDVLWASGTPIKAIGAEAIPFFACIDPMFDADAQKRFLGIFGKSASRALDILANRLGMVMFQVPKEEIMAGTLRPVTRELKITIPDPKEFLLDTIRQKMLDYTEERLKYYAAERPRIQAFYDECIKIHESKLTTNQQRAALGVYKQYIRSIARGYDPAAMVAFAVYCNQYELKQIIPSIPREMGVRFKDIRSVIKYVELKVRGECLGRIVGRARIECCKEVSKYIPFEQIIADSEKKTVVFTTYVDVVDSVYTDLRSKGFEPLRVYGDTNREVTSIITRFEREPEINPLVATFKSLSTAVPLVCASSVVLVNPPYRSYEYDQAISRLDRLGQDSQVEIYTAVLDTGNAANISSRTLDIMQWSKEQVDAILGKYGFHTIGVDDSLDAEQ